MKLITFININEKLYFVYNNKHNEKRTAQKESGSGRRNNHERKYELHLERKNSLKPKLRLSRGLDILVFHDEHRISYL